MKKYIEPKTIYINLATESLMQGTSTPDLHDTEYGGTTGDQPGGEIEGDTRRQGIWGWGLDK